MIGIILMLADGAGAVAPESTFDWTNCLFNICLVRGITYVIAWLAAGVFYDKIIHSRAAHLTVLFTCSLLGWIVTANFVVSRAREESDSYIVVLKLALSPVLIERLVAAFFQIPSRDNKSLHETTTRRLYFCVSTALAIFTFAAVALLMP